MSRENYDAELTILGKDKDDYFLFFIQRPNGSSPGFVGIRGRGAGTIGCGSFENKGWNDRNFAYQRFGNTHLEGLCTGKRNL